VEEKEKMNVHNLRQMRTWKISGVGILKVAPIEHQQNLKNLFAFSGFSAAFPVADKRDKLTSWDPISWI
jgi:hypothetical protein